MSLWTMLAIALLLGSSVAVKGYEVGFVKGMARATELTAPRTLVVRQDSGQCDVIEQQSGQSIELKGDRPLQARIVMLVQAVPWNAR